MKILLISTHDGLIHHVKLTLHDSGHSLTIVNTANDAIAKIQLDLPAVIMLDINSVNTDAVVKTLGQHHASRPAIVVFSRHQAPSFELLSLGVHGFGQYDDNHPPPVLNILTQLQRPTLAQQQDKPTIITRTHHGTERIMIEHILYCQAEHKYTKIHHQYGTTLINDSLKSLQSTHPDEFIRIHRNTLVSIRHIQAINGKSLTIYGMATPLTISRRCLPKLLSKFIKYQYLS